MGVDLTFTAKALCCPVSDQSLESYNSLKPLSFFIHCWCFQCSSHCSGKQRVISKVKMFLLLSFRWETSFLQLLLVSSLTFSKTHRSRAKSIHPLLLLVPPLCWLVRRSMEHTSLSTSNWACLAEVAMLTVSSCGTRAVASRFCWSTALKEVKGSQAAVILICAERVLTEIRALPVREVSRSSPEPWQSNLFGMILPR